MSTLKIARRLLLASALASGAIGAAMAQDSAQQAQPLQNSQAQPAPDQTSSPAMPAQYGAQDQAQAQPLGTANAGEGLQGLPVDQVTDVQGVQTMCTGIGKGDETTPPGNFPVKFELVGGYGQWLGNEQLTVNSSGGSQVVSVHCSGPWVLMKLNPGRYSVTADVPDAGSKTVSVSVPASGQREVMIRFTNAQQGQSGEHATQGPAVSSGT